MLLAGLAQMRYYIYISIVLFLIAPIPFNEKHLLHISTKDKFSASITKFWGSMAGTTMDFVPSMG